MKIEKFKCYSCEKLNNYSESMRCSSCNALHNKEGAEQLFKLSFTMLSTNVSIDDLQPINEKELRMVLGLSSVNDEIWIKQVELLTYSVGMIKYEWEKV